MKNIWILGGTGMLGHAVLKEFINLNDGKYKLYATRRPSSSNYLQSNSNVEVYNFDPTKQHLSSLFVIGKNKPDYIINCIGVIKPFINDNLYNSIYINSCFPHSLDGIASKFDCKLIQITTDCVFDGTKGNYTEQDKHTETDMYGKSKSLGEPTNSLVLRTSIIGPEIHKNASLISWAKSQKNKEINGYINHIWNGITTKEYGRLCKKIIDEDLYRTGKFHIFSPDKPLQKITLLKMISDKYNLNLKVIPHEAPTSCNRSLVSEFDFYKSLDIHPLYKQLELLQ